MFHEVLVPLLYATQVTAPWSILTGFVNQCYLDTNRRRWKFKLLPFRDRTGRRVMVTLGMKGMEHSILSHGVFHIDQLNYSMIESLMSLWCTAGNDIETHNMVIIPSSTIANYFASVADLRQGQSRSSVLYITFVFIRPTLFLFRFGP